MNRRNFEWNVIPHFSGTNDQDDLVSDCLIDKFYVSGAEFAEDAEAMKALGITHVISVIGSSLRGSQYQTHEGFEYYRIMGVHDDPSASILKYIGPVLEFYDSVPEGNKLLIHCQMGVSRSASLAIACLMHVNPEWPMERAYDTVKASRPIIGPEPEFLFQINEYFDSLRSGWTSPEKVHDLLDCPCVGDLGFPIQRSETQQMVHEAYIRTCLPDAHSNSLYDDPKMGKKVVNPYAEFEKQRKVYITRSWHVETCSECQQIVRMLPNGGGLCGCSPTLVYVRTGKPVLPGDGVIIEI